MICQFLDMEIMEWELKWDRRISDVNFQKSADKNLQNACVTFEF